MARETRYITDKDSGTPQIAGCSITVLIAGSSVQFNLLASSSMWVTIAVKESSPPDSMPAAAPYFVRWVRRFLSRPASDEPMADQVREFCEELDGAGGVEGVTRDPGSDVRLRRPRLAWNASCRETRMYFLAE